MFSSFCVIFFFEVWLCLSVIKKSKKKKKELERKNKRFSFDSLRIFEKNQNCVKIFKFVSFSLFLILFFFFFALSFLKFHFSFYSPWNVPVRTDHTHRLPLTLIIPIPVFPFSARPYVLAFYFIMPGIIYFNVYRIYQRPVL